MSTDAEKGFSKNRLETLTDGVFAIVMTLLVLGIAVPQLTSSEVAIELPKKLLELWPVVFSYVTSFMILGFLWIGNHEQFHYITHSNRTLAWITIFYLMFVAFVPFSTALLGKYNDQQISVIIYGINIIIIGSLINVKWWYVTKNHCLIDKNLDSSFVRTMSRRFLVGPIAYLIAVAVSFVSIETSLILYIATPLYYVIPFRKDKFRGIN